MSLNPDPQTTHALRKLANTSEWELVAKWLKDRREAYVQTSFNPDTVICRKAQGAITEIDELLKITNVQK